MLYLYILRVASADEITTFMKPVISMQFDYCVNELSATSPQWPSFKCFEFPAMRVKQYKMRV